MNILVLNAGSSSLKFQIVATDHDRIQKDADVRLLRGEVDRIGGEAVVTIQKGNGPKQKLTASLPDISAALDYVIRWIASPDSGISEIQSVSDIHAVGHRVVHGGELFTESVPITDEVLKGIENCIDLAPLHNPVNLRGIRAVRDLLIRCPKSPYLIRRFTIRFRNIPICTRSRITCICATKFAGTASTESRTGTWPTATGCCAASRRNRRI
jgi:acetate kinase